LDAEFLTAGLSPDGYNERGRKTPDNGHDDAR